MRQLKDLGLIIAYELHGFRYKAIAESTVLTGGCAKKYTKEELLEVLLECR